MVTQEMLKDVLHFCESTGIFTRIKRTSNKINIGDKAGYINNCGYSLISIYGKKYQAHKLAWLYMCGEWPNHEIDHINHNKADNRFVNLRSVTHKENGKNTSLKSNNKSGVNGVSYSKERKKWVADIRIDGRTIFLGRFKYFMQAVAARFSADIEYDFHVNHGSI